MKVLKELAGGLGFICIIFLIIQTVVGASLINETQTIGQAEVIGLKVAKVYKVAIGIHNLKFPDNPVQVIDFNDDEAISAFMNR
jgi:hypothetical protein